MYGLVSARHFLKGKSLSKVLVDDLYERALFGKVIIVAENPPAMLSAVRKQWCKKLYRLSVEYAGLRSSAVRQRLADRIYMLKRLTFTAQPPEDILQANITIATANDLVCAYPECHFAFVTYEFPREQLHMLTVWMPPGGVVIIYEE